MRHLAEAGLGVVGRGVRDGQATGSAVEHLHIPDVGSADVLTGDANDNIGVAVAVDVGHRQCGGEVVARLRDAGDLCLALPQDVTQALSDEAVGVAVQDDQPSRSGLAVDGRVRVANDGVGAVVTVEVGLHSGRAPVRGRDGDGRAGERNGQHKGKAGE